MPEDGTSDNPVSFPTSRDGSAGTGQYSKRRLGRTCSVPETQAVGLSLVDTALVHVVRDATAWAETEVVATHGPGQFLGALDLLTGRALFVAAGGAQRPACTT